MPYEEILITHDDYTDTAYPTCGEVRCSMAVLAAVGLSEQMMAEHGVDSPEEVFELSIGENTQVTCARLGETGSDEWCAACGEFLGHGVDCECPDKDTDRDDQDRPHIDLANAASIKELWT